MSNLTVKPQSHVQEFTPEQLDLIKATVAKNATDDELRLFLYRCKRMELDPLKPGQVHFIKYGSNAGSIVTGIDGFRAKASRTGMHTGTKRGVIRDEKGKCIGGWAEVYRSDWTQPAREEVSLSEYDTGKAQWAKMPETMIKKVAEAAALRMAFPDELGDLYTMEEMEQGEQKASRARDVQERIANNTEAPEFETADYFKEPEVEDPNGPGEYKLRSINGLKGKKLSQVPQPRLQKILEFADGEIAAGKEIHPDVLEDVREIRAYLAFTMDERI